jgi:hypothetical protein
MSRKICADDAFNWALGAYSLSQSVGYYTENMAKHLRGRAVFAVIAKRLGFITGVDFPNNNGSVRTRMIWSAGVPTKDQATELFAGYNVYMEEAETRRKEKLQAEKAKAEVPQPEQEEQQTPDPFDSAVPDTSAPTVTQLLTSIDVKLGRLLQLWEEPARKKSNGGKDKTAPTEVSSLRDLDKLIPHRH